MQIDPEQIPDEVVEAAKLAAAEYLATGVNHTEEKLFSAAITAALNAWPNAKTLRDDGRRQTYIVPALILPLSQEPNNDQV
jgi:hypothetical protein